MGDADAEEPTGDEDPPRLGHRRLHVGDVHERVVGDDQVAAGVGQRQSGGVGQQVAAGLSASRA
jgi:hypothetical protein